MYKEASRQALTFQTNKGLLNVERLWQLSLSELDELAVSLEQEHKQSGKRTFLNKRTSKDKVAKLRFDIVLDILNTKSEEAEALKNAASIKSHNEKILALIAAKQEEELQGKSVEELTALLKESK